MLAAAYLTLWRLLIMKNMTISIIPSHLALDKDLNYFHLPRFPDLKDLS